MFRGTEDCLDQTDPPPSPVPSRLTAKRGPSHSAFIIFDLHSHPNHLSIHGELNTFPVVMLPLGKEAPMIYDHGCCFCRLRLHL